MVNQSDLITNVPTPEAVTALGFEWLERLGISTADLAKKPDSDEFDLHWRRETIGNLDRTNKTDITLTNECGVFFLRQMDGIPFRGIGMHGGVEIEFGNNASIYLLRLNWRKLERYKNRKCVSPEDIITSIKSGEIHLPPTACGCGEIKRITITKVYFRYDAETGGERQEYVEPFIYLRARVVGSLKEDSFTFEAPILSARK